MAVATATLTNNTYPKGNDNTQRRQINTGTAAIGATPLTYTAGGIRINFANLEAIKASQPYLLPTWLQFLSLAGSGYIYTFNPLGPAITNIALTTNVVTITAKNNLAVGDIVIPNGITTATFLNGAPLTVASASATSFTANFTHGNYGSAADTGFALPTSYASGLPFQGNLQIFTGAAAQSPLTELANGATPAAVAADVIAFKAEFVRL